MAPIYNCTVWFRRGQCDFPQNRSIVFLCVNSQYQWDPATPNVSAVLLKCWTLCNGEHNAGFTTQRCRCVLHSVVCFLYDMGKKLNQLCSAWKVCCGSRSAVNPHWGKAKGYSQVYHRGTRIKLEIHHILVKCVR